MGCPACGNAYYRFYRRETALIQGTFGGGKASEVKYDSHPVRDSDPQRVECCDCGKTFSARHAREMPEDGSIPPNDMTFSTPTKKS